MKIRLSLVFQIFALLIALLLLYPFYVSASKGKSHPVKKPLDKIRNTIESLPFSVHGFFEGRGGIRTQNDPQMSKDLIIGEPRLQLDLGKIFDWAEFRVKSDFLYDFVLERGDVDLREANAIFTPFDFLDMKIGRQILTWGTGDFIFINDLFPKDFKSFFIGRDDEYLKAPSDAAKFSFFTKVANLDIVYTPQFDPDRFIEGERLSFFSDSLGHLVGENNKVNADEPNDFFDDSETAVRIFKNFKGYELAGYGYYGFWKGPAGENPATGLATFPELAVYGTSARGDVFKGIGNLEFGYYDSLEDRKGSDPNVRNSELRLLIGYDQELARDFTAGVQYYLQFMLKYNDYRRALPDGTPPRDESRHVLTLRLTKLLMNQNLKLSLFAFYSPSDQDAHFRPKVHYKFSDHLSGEIGANVFVGEHDFTFFGQLENNTNIYTGLRYSF